MTATKRTALGILAALALAVGLLLVGTSAASAEDTRSCVSKVEYQSYQSFVYRVGHLPTLAQVEDHWESQSDHEAAMPYGPVEVFKRCGYSLKEAWYGLALTNAGRGWATAEWHAEDATLHGRP